MSGKLEEKRIFLVATMDEVRKDMFSSVIQKHISNSTVFFAADGAEALFKIENAPPDVFITDYALPKMTGIDVVQQVVSKAKFDDVSIIICARLPDKEHFVDEVVTGKVQFFLEPGGEPRLAHCLTRALNRLTKDDVSDYRLVFLAPDEVLIQEGEIGKSVFIVKKGTLQAYKSKKGCEVILGEITSGEFVGEMSHINHEPRSASVRALSDCELIEIPYGTLDLVLFSKPSWSKALVATLSKRLKKSNETVLKKTN